MPVQGDPSSQDWSMITLGNTLVSLVTYERRCKRCGILGFTLKDRRRGEGGCGGEKCGKLSVFEKFELIRPILTLWHRWCRRSTASSSVLPDVRLLLTCPCSRIHRLIMLLVVANSSSLFFLFLFLYCPDPCFDFDFADVSKRRHCDHFRKTPRFPLLQISPVCSSTTEALVTTICIRRRHYLHCSLVLRHLSETAP